MSISAAFWGAATAGTASFAQPVVQPTGSGVSRAAGALIAGGMFLWLVLAVAALKWWRVWRVSSIVGPRRTGDRETIWTQIFIFGYGLLGGSLAAVVAGRSVHGSGEVRALLVTSAAEVTAWIILVGLTARLRRDGLRHIGLSLGQLLPGVAIGLGAIAVLFPIVAGASELTGLYLEWTGRPEPAPHEVLQSLVNPSSRWVAALSIGVAVVVAPLFEELAFRGFLQTVLGRLFGWFWGEAATSRWAAVVLTAMAFAAVHGVAAFAPALFVLAVGLGYVYERTGKLWATITMHAMFNAVQIVLFVTVAHG